MSRDEHENAYTRKSHLLLHVALLLQRLNVYSWQSWLREDSDWLLKCKLFIFLKLVFHGKEAFPHLNSCLLFTNICPITALFIYGCHYLFILNHSLGYGRALFTPSNLSSVVHLHKSHTISHIIIMTRDLSVCACNLRPYTKK